MTGIAHVALIVRDMDAMAQFYEQAIGLTPMGGDGGQRDLGAGGRVLIRLLSDPAARPRDPAAAGLFHTAFLLPSKADLGGWLRHAADTGLRLTGASDHGVSRALYLDDPEGNGIEIYDDRPRSAWIREGDRVRMASDPLDLDVLIEAAQGPWRGAPQGTIIGHVHLQVGDLAAADGFLRGTLGLTQTFSGPGGGWYGWDGYHHHLAANVWNSRGAGPRPAGHAGLAHVALSLPQDSPAELTDPWGNRFLQGDPAV